MSNLIHYYEQLYAMWPELEQFKEKIYIFSSEYIADPLKVVNDIRIQHLFGKTKFVFYAPMEALMDSYCDGIHAVIDILIDRIDSSNFIYISGGVQSSRAYEELSKERKWTNKITILNCFYWEKNASIRFAASPAYVVKVKPKKFLCFNRVPRQHRIELLENMFKHNLVDSAYYSFDKTLDFNEHKEDVEILEKYPHVHKNQHRLPLELNLYKDCENPATSTIYDLKYYENSYFSVVTETKFHYQDIIGHEEYRTRDMFITEKVIKPIVFKHPFIVLAASNYLTELRAMGYKTFHPYIDETYDTVEDDNERFNMVVEEITRLCTKTHKEWLQWQLAVKDIIEFNNRVFYSRKDHRITTDVEKYFK
jgi:hypothetical protein